MSLVIVTDKEDEPKRQVCIQPQCGVCHEPFQRNDNLIALCRHNNTIEAHDAHKHISGGECEQGSFRNVRFCKEPYCRHSLTELETATIHKDCFQLFLQECKAEDKYYRLWKASIAMLPWYHCSPLVIPNRRKLNDVDRVSRDFNLPLLKSLPLEIVDMIDDYIDSDLIWRYRIAVQQAAILSMPLPLNKETVPLCDVLYWSRFSEEVVTCGILDPTSQLIQITIDSYGIQTIERIYYAQQKPIRYTPTSHQLFIVEYASNLSPVYACFESGYCRLIFSQNINIALLNDPLPPGHYPSINSVPKQPIQPRLIAQMPPSIQQYKRFQLIDTSSCFGITFFLVQHTILSIHAHTPKAPTARDTLRQLSSTLQLTATWLYIPLSDGDKFITFGARYTEGSPQYFIHTELQGVVEISQRIDTPSKSRIFKTCSRPLLIYDIYSSHIYIPKDHIKEDTITTIQPLLYTKQPLFWDACFTRASLRNIATAFTFIDRQTQLCNGIILQYKNGSVKPLGQYRLGIDRIKYIHNPKYICYAVAEYSALSPVAIHNGVMVEFSECDNHLHNITIKGTTWICHRTTGVAEFWFGSLKSKLVITEE